VELAKLVGSGRGGPVSEPSACCLVVFQPYFASGNQSSSLTKFNAQSRLFDLRGVDSPRGLWCLRCRRPGWRAHSQVVPTIVTTLVFYAALAFATGGWLRMHYLTPLSPKTQRAGLRADREPVGAGRRVVFTGPPTFLSTSSIAPLRQLGQGRWTVVRESLQ